MMECQANITVETTEYIKRGYENFNVMSSQVLREVCVTRVLSVML